MFAKIDPSTGFNSGSRLAAVMRKIAANFTLLEPGIKTSAALDYVPQLGDRIITRTNAAAQTTTIQTNAAVPFDIGTKIDIIPTGAGAHSIVAANGVTINPVAGKPLTTPQYGKASLTKISANVWNLNGDLA